MSAKSSNEQSELFLVAEQSGQMHPLDMTYYDPLEQDTVLGAHVSVIEHHILLQNVITNFARVRQLNGQLKFDDRELKFGGDPMPAPKRRNYENRRNESAKAGNEAFYRAIGNDALEEMFSWDELRAARATRSQMMSDFMKQYISLKDYVGAQAFRRQLVNTVRVLQEDRHTLYNRTEGKRPHQVLPKNGPRTETERKLDTPGRLRAILGDPRAGFLPTTHREKNQVVSYLDYLDNPEYPFGVNNQLLEIFNKSQSLLTKQKIKRVAEEELIDSERGPESVVYELGNYLMNASDSRRALEELEILLIEMPNTRVTLFEEHENADLDLKHPGLAALIRYRELVEYLKTGEASIPGDPLRTKEHILKSKGPGKHKDVGDRYTAYHRPDKMEDYIYAEVARTTVGRARMLIGPAIVDQTRRENFMTELLKSIATQPTAIPGRAKKALEKASIAAHAVLEEAAARPVS